MSTLITLRHLQVSNANAIAGLTYGFPAITQFLGYTHALSRKLQQSHGIELTRCAVVCHHHQIQAYQPSGWGDFIFALTRNPLTKEGKTAPIVEEGRMQMEISLVFECEGLIAGGEAGVAALREHLWPLCQSQRLAGGLITGLQNIDIATIPATEEESSAFIRRQMRRLLPGFVLVDRSALLQQHLSALQESKPDADILDAWLDFAALKYQAVAPRNDEGNVEEGSKAEWIYQPKPNTGWLVPIMTGYRAISPCYAPGEVGNTRDLVTPFRFAEAVYGIGEWKSPHNIDDLGQVFWHYRHDNDWYLCQTSDSVVTESTSQLEESFDFVDY